MPSIKSLGREEEPLLAEEIAEATCARNTGLPTAQLEPDVSIASSEHGHGKRVGDTIGINFRIATAMFSFLVMGMIQSTTGVMIPHWEKHYGLSDTLVSLIFLLTPLGYFVAAYFNSLIHLQLGQRGIAAIGPICQLTFAVGLCAHPPYPIIITLSVFGAIGTGLLDGSWCAWAGAMDNANTVQGFLHGSYSVGASLGPFIAGTMVSAAETPWWRFYYVLSAFCLVMLSSSVYAFRFEGAEVYRAQKHDTVGDEAHPNKSDSLAIFKHIATWICAAYFLAYVGIESSITGWIVVYMIRARHASDYLASICSSLFNIGMAAGRLSLGVLTDRLGVRLAVIVYLSIATILQALFALVNIPVVSAIIMTVIGFFLGPMFPSGVVMITRLLPTHLHVGAVSFVAALGEVGGAVLPFALGAIADRLGIGAFQYIILVQLIVTLFIWISFPRLPAKSILMEDAHEHGSLQEQRED